MFSFCVLLLSLAASTYAQTSVVKLCEIDSSPCIPSVQEIRVPNGSLTRSGGKGTLTFSTASGDVVGPASATDNAVVRFDLTTGKLIQNSGVIIDDSNVITGVARASLSGGTISGSSTTSNFLNVTGTMPTTLSANTYGIYYAITGAGSSNQLSSALNVEYLAGYTGGNNTVAITALNSSAGTNTGFANGNRALLSVANATTTGNNFGIASAASNGNQSFGGHFAATTTKNSATNVGVLGVGLNGGSSPVQIGGYFALGNSYPTFVSGALIANNGTQTDPIFRAQDNGADSFVVLDGGRVYGTALHNNAGAVTGTTNQYIASGTYTPTLTNVTNVAASTAYVCQWTRVGNVVTVSGKFDLDATAAAATELGISLPIASALAAEEQLGGVATTQVAATPSGRVRADATNDRAAVVFTATSVTNDSYSFTFTYVVL